MQFGVYSHLCGVCSSYRLTDTRVAVLGMGQRGVWQRNGDGFHGALGCSWFNASDNTVLTGNLTFRDGGKPHWEKKDLQVTGLLLGVSKKIRKTLTMFLAEKASPLF